MRMLRILLAVVLVGIVGCGETQRIAPVSGTITLDGEPLDGAVVGFEPVATGDSIEAGYGSYGRTDDQGRYSLISLKRENGALVGTHRVSISTMIGEEGPDGEMAGLTKERVPARYNDSTELRFEVPPGGTDQANFDLSSK